MREVFKASLADIKTVFNSESDNTQYYDRLKNANCHIIDNIELAKPFIKSNDVSIIWKSESNLTFESFNNLSDEKQAEVSFRLTNFFEKFKQTIGKFKSVSPDFANQLIQIPNKNSILVNTDTQYIVIVNWGFLEDSFDRKENIIKHLFSKSKSSILIKLLNNKSNPISNFKLKLDSKSTREIDITDDQGRARFGTLEKGEIFSIYREDGLEQKLLKDFECDNREEYIITIDQDIKINLIFKDEDGEPVNSSTFTVQVQGETLKDINTQDKNQYDFLTNVNPFNFRVLDQTGKEVFKHEIPDYKTTYVIIVDPIIDNEESLVEDEEEIVEDPISEEEEEEEVPTTFRFINAFNKPIKELQVNFTDSEKNSFSETTDEKGEIHQEFPNSEINYSFVRYKEVWNDTIEIGPGDVHIIITRPIFPWLWWLLMAILLYLLICCAFFTCFTCDFIETNEYVNKTPQEEKAAVEERIQNCNSKTKSGGEGVTTTKHMLGNKAGQVEIRYDMQSIPDKMEVFYENNLIVSTYDIKGNINGFVGDDLNTGCCGVLRFKFVPNQDDFCEIVITGSNSTAWSYLISCPL